LFFLNGAALSASPASFASSPAPGPVGKSDPWAADCCGTVEPEAVEAKEEEDEEKEKAWEALKVG